MRAERHLMMRRLRVLLAWAVVLWGAGMAVPPSRAEEPAHYAPRSLAAQRVVQARVTARPTASPRAERPLPPAAQVVSVEAAEHGVRPRIYLLFGSLLL